MRQKRSQRAGVHRKGKCKRTSESECANLKCSALGQGLFLVSTRQVLSLGHLSVVDQINKHTSLAAPALPANLLPYSVSGHRTAVYNKLLRLLSSENNISGKALLLRPRTTGQPIARSRAHSSAFTPARPNGPQRTSEIACQVQVWCNIISSTSTTGATVPLVGRAPRSESTLFW